MLFGWCTSMATASRRAHKHFQLDAVKIKRAQKALRAKTETETIERALDVAISSTKAIGSLPRPTSVSSEAAAKSKTFSENWIARCELPCSIPLSTLAECVGETMPSCRCGGSRSMLRFGAVLWCSRNSMLEHRAAFDSRWNEWSATSTGSNGFCFPPSVTGLKPDECGRAWRLEMATKRSGRDVWQTMR